MISNIEVPEEANSAEVLDPWRLDEAFEGQDENSRAEIEAPKEKKLRKWKRKARLVVKEFS